MTARPFAATLKAIHADAVRVAIATHDEALSPGIIPGCDPAPSRGALVDLALECAGELGYEPRLIPSTAPVVEYWLRCYDTMTATLREPPPPFVSGQRVRVAVGVHAGRLGTVRIGALASEPTIEIDSDGAHIGSLYVRTTRPATFAEWVQ